MERRVNTKVSCTVWSRGKSGDHIKALPIAIGVEWKSWYQRVWESDSLFIVTGRFGGYIEPDRFFGMLWLIVFSWIIIAIVGGYERKMQKF